MRSDRLLRVPFLVAVVSVIGCATQAEAVQGSPSMEQGVDESGPAQQGLIRDGDPKMIDQAMAALSKGGSQCEYLPAEPNVAACDQDRDGHVTLVLLHQGPRLYLISHILRADGVQCRDVAWKLNEINAKFDGLTVVCADNITFRTSVTLSEAGLTGEELVAIADQYRTEIQTIIRAGLLQGVAKD